MQAHAQRCGFTLIELLIALGVIGILSSLLYPVFVRAREESAVSVCASNEKQIGLAMLQYVQDNDGRFPLGTDAQWKYGWADEIMPYIDVSRAAHAKARAGTKTQISVFRCPVDTSTTLASWASSAWAGPAISYATNSVTVGHQNAPKLIGVITPMGQAWVSTDSRASEDVPRPSFTVLIAEKHNDDVVKYGGLGVTTSYIGDMFYGASLSGFDWCAPMEEPDGTRSASAAYPAGPNGAVSAKHNGLSNFLFVDGHVKAMHPYETNPDPVKRPADNMWDATRS